MFAIAAKTYLRLSLVLINVCSHLSCQMSSSISVELLYAVGWVCQVISLFALLFSQWHKDGCVTGQTGWREFKSDKRITNVISCFSTTTKSNNLHNDVIRILINGQSFSIFQRDTCCLSCQSFKAWAMRKELKLLYQSFKISIKCNIEISHDRIAFVERDENDWGVPFWL